MLTQRRLLLMFPILLLTVSGCSDLILRDSDSAEQTTGKVLARVLLCPITICLSELELASAKDREIREAKEAAYWRWVRSLPPEQQAREYALEQARIQAAGQALMGLGMSGGLFRNTPAPVSQPRPAPQLPILQQPPRTVPPVSCSSRQAGQMVYTDCY